MALTLAVFVSDFVFPCNTSVPECTEITLGYLSLKRNLQPCKYVCQVSVQTERRGVFNHYKRAPVQNPNPALVNVDDLCMRITRIRTGVTVKFTRNGRGTRKNQSEGHMTFVGLQRLTLWKVVDLCALCASRFVDPALGFYVATTSWRSAAIPNLFHFVIIQLTVEYLVARKFQQWTCCRGGVLSWNHTGIQRAAESKPFFHKCLQNQFACLGA